MRGQLGAEGEHGVLFGDWPSSSVLQFGLAAIDQALKVVQSETIEVGGGVHVFSRQAAYILFA